MSGHKVDIREPFSSELKIRGNALKLLIFRIYSRLYHQEALEEKSILKLKVTEALWSIIWCLQVISFLWTSNLSIENWEENMIVWNAIGIFRLDNICSQLGTMRECLYLSFTITFMLGVSMTCLAICIYCSLSVAKLFGILRLFFNFWLIFFLIPSMAIYSIFLKYNIWPQKYISEYKENNQEDFEISPGLQFTIVLALITNFPLLYFYNQFTSEIRHSESTKTIKAKAHSKIDCHIAIFTYFLPIFFTLFNESYIIYFQFFMMIVSIIIVAESEMLLPYFSLYYNLMQNLKLFTVAIFSFGFVLGYIMNNSLLIIFIAAILGPISAAILVQLTIKLQKQINLADLADLKEINSEYELEKKLRYWLCLKDTEHKDEIIQIFEKFIIKNNNRGKFQIIWVANYCLYTLKDGPLAKVKLSKAKTISSWNLEADFQEYLLASAILGICNKNINESSSNESLIFINYYQQLNLIKNKDAKLCTHLLNFWEELTSSRPDLNGLKKRLEWINEMILYLNNQYIKLAMEFPGSRECLTLYTSYSNDIIYDYEKSNLLENKLRGLNNLNSANAELKKLSFFNESSGILIISGEPDSFGHILFANPRAAEIMKNSIFSLEESNIMDFIHTYYWKSLKQELKWLIHYGSSSQIEFSKGFFLSIPGRYLIECKGKAVITSIDNNICFILNFQIKQIRHQAALLTDSGEILCWTENFSELAGIYNENLIDCNIKDVFTEIGRYGAEIIFQSQNSQATLVASHIDIYKFKVFYAILRNDHEGIPRWKNENSYNIKKEKEAAYNNSLNQGKSLKTYEISDEKPLKSEMKLIHSNSNVSLVYHENNSVSKSSDARSQFLSKKKFFKMLVIASRSINILHFAFILSVIFI
ncbi:unnamed protein product [Blepharisma stoltei]|uniref:TmcB/TmcC TPR repeats domain-containing protein n=1 Tax=Blepharisma stoltei TaxID=1481888 RepID=A0AAU9IB91_9CILI|nr:unnamed protein product [Blepharisma stoltei]